MFVVPSIIPNIAAHRQYLSSRHLFKTEVNTMAVNRPERSNSLIELVLLVGVTSEIISRYCSASYIFVNIIYS